LQFSQAHTRLFLDQVYANAIGGFVPNTNIPDPNFGKCLQCAAIDRARYQINPAVPRSDFCTQCFTQYCFDPNNPPSSSELPGRVLAFENPDPQGVSALTSFLSRGKVGLILGFLGAVLVIAAISTFLCVSVS
jgi:lysophospholipase